MFCDKFCKKMRRQNYIHKKIFANFMYDKEYMAIPSIYLSMKSQNSAIYKNPKNLIENEQRT